MASTPPKTRYARSPHGHIAYKAVGEGPFDVVMVPGFVSNVEAYWEIPAARTIVERITSFSRLIVWDKRGTGLSDPVAGVPTLEERIDDLLAVMDAAGSEQPAFWGVSEGGPMSLLFAATYPDRVRSLVLYGTAPCFSIRDGFPSGWSEEEVEGMLVEIERDWGEGALMDYFAPGYVDDDDMREAWGAYQRAGASPAMGRSVIQALAEIDVRSVLDAIRVPTLVLHRSGDRIASLEGARLIAERIPGARIVEWDDPNHLPFVGPVEPMLDEMEEFLTGTRAPRPTNRMLATVMFTDIVDSTRRAAELGDRAWRELLEGHDALVRKQLNRYAGREIKTIGDGFLATFDGPARGIQCAVEIGQEVGGLGIEVRAGLHTGECEDLGADIGGMAVNIGARVSALAGPGEVLVSRTVKDLVVGSGIEFAERGEHELKGVPDSWRLFAVA